MFHGVRTVVCIILMADSPSKNYVYYHIYLLYVGLVLLCVRSSWSVLLAFWSGSKLAFGARPMVMMSCVINNYSEW